MSDHTPEPPAGDPGPSSPQREPDNFEPEYSMAPVPEYVPEPVPEPPPEPQPAPEPEVPAGSRRSPPVFQDRNIRAWLWLLTGICLLAALWIPIRTTYQRIAFKPETTGPRDADSFIALAYGGVSGGEKPGYEEVTRKQFEEHIRALRERGFNPIGLSDVRDFYQKGRLLPRKAVLVTMEQSKKVSYLETHDILRHFRWKAVMFVRSDTIREEEPSALRWPILRDMARSGTWEIGAESSGGYRRIPVGPEGETGNFFSSPMWIPKERRLETPKEFADRIRADHRQMVAEFNEGMGEAPTAFAFPYGDYGQYDPRAVPTRVMNVSAVSKTYGIGFSLGPFLLNTRNSNPCTLNRLMVRSEWDLEQFISIVESGWAVQPWKMNRPLDPSRWQADWGLTEHPKDGSLWLKAIGPQKSAAKSSVKSAVKSASQYKPTTGALAWLVASDLFGDFSMRMRFRVMAGQFGIRLRARPSGEEGVRVLFDADGSCWVNQKVYGAEEFTHAVTESLGATPGKERELEITLKGRNLFATLDGRMLLKEPLDLLGENQRGLLGLEVWSPTPGVAATQVVSLDFPQPQRVLKYWPREPDIPSVNLMRELDHGTATLAVVSPPWMEALHSAPLVLPKWDDETVHIFSKMHDVMVLPRIDVHSAQVAAQIPPEVIVSDVAAMKANGVNLDCRQVEAKDIPDIIQWMQSVHRNIKEQKMKLAIQFPDSMVKLASFASIAALFPGALMAVESPERAAQVEGAVPDVLVAEEVRAPAAADMHLRLYYQLATRNLPMEELSPQARQEALRRQGYGDFQEGEYDKAIADWGRWLAEDPNSAEAMSLIGRAYMQKNDLNKALDYYTRSLQTSPGQIRMVVRRSELLEKMDRVDEAREQLNLYARIFPENPDITIAQAQWLDRRQRHTEARTMVETLVKEMPLNLEARLALLNLQDNFSDRFQTMRSILELGRAPDSQIPFGHSLLSMEMLTFPESSVFFDYLRDQARRGQNTKQRELYESFLPLAERVTDDFTTGQLSDGWIASNGMRPMERGRYELRAAIDQAETYLRLKRSELMRDGCMEVVLDESQGLFWLYARRSSRGMVRFGFDQEGYIHLQAWNRGEMVAQASRPWIRPPGSLKMRLELRGDGARGFVNGTEIFSGPVGIPASVAYGWWGIAPFAFDLGIARARILRLDCEPLPTGIALMSPGDADKQIGLLRPLLGSISALAPAWIFQKPDGTLPEGMPEGAEVLRMFAAFHQVRLLPVIDLSYDGDIKPALVADFIHRNNLAGAVLKRRSPAPAPWLEALAAELEKNPADVIVLQTEAALWNVPRAGTESLGELVVRPPVASNELLPKPGEPIVVRELAVGNVLIPPLYEEWKVNLTAPGDQEPPPPQKKDLTTPRLYLLGADGKLVTAATPLPPKE